MPVSGLYLFLILVLLIAAPRYSLAQNYQSDQIRTDLIRQRQMVAADDQYVARLFRGVMKTHDQSNWVNLDLTLMDSLQISSAVLLDYGTGPVGFMFGYQVYLLNTGVKDEYGSEETAAGYNMFYGVNFYLRELKTKIFTGAYISAARRDGGSLSRSEIDKAARAGQRPELKVTDIIVPYVFINSPVTNVLRARADFNFENSSLSRMGLGAFLWLTGFEVGSTYDTLSVLNGTMYDVGIEGRYFLPDSRGKSRGNDDYASHIRLKFAKLFTVSGSDSFNSGFNESNNTYVLAELLLSRFICGISHKSPEGTGFRLGLKAQEDELTMTLSYQNNYIFDSVYGTRINSWSIYFDMKRSL